MEPLDLLTNPAYSWYPGNVFGESLRQSQQPSAPPPPRMGQGQLDTAVSDLAAYFSDARNHESAPTSVSESEMKRALGKVSPAATQLLDLALADRGVRGALRGATREGWRNAAAVSTRDLQALAQGGTTLGRLRSAVRVDSAR